MSHTGTQHDERSSATSDLAALRVENRRLHEALQAAREEARRARRSEAWLQSLLDHVPLSIVTIDRQGTILSVNRTLTGQPTENAVGTSCFDYLAEAIRDDCRRALDEAFEAGQPTRYECRTADPDGRFWEAIFTPIAVSGEVTTAVVIMQDITQRKRVEEQARGHVAQVAHIQRVNAMGEMVAELAHEIGQPLYAITNFAQAGAQVLRSGNKSRSGDLLEWLDRISEQASRAGSIIRRLGGLIRKGQPDRIAVNLNRLIPNVIELTRARARADAIEIDFRPAKTLPDVVADPVQIEQVLVNLVQNAIEAIVASEPRRRCVDVWTAYCPDSSTVEIAVRDTATAPLPDDVDAMFEAFYTTKPQGMGMGLAVSRSIVEGHGGQIRVVPCPEGGTTLRLSLPQSPGGEA